MMFINNVSANGFNHEGFGSVLSFKLMSYGLSRALNLKYIDNPFENIIGYTYEGLDIESYADKLNLLFGFNYQDKTLSNQDSFDIFFDYPTKKKLNIASKYLMESKRNFFYWLFNKNIKKIENTGYIKDLLKEREFNNQQLYFKDGKNIAIHLRSPRQDLDIRFEGHRNRFYGSFQDIDKINNTIRQIEHSEKSVKLNFHIVTTCDEKLFKHLDTMFDRNEIHLHLDTNVFDSLEILLYSDILVVSGSGLSYSAHLLNNNKTLMPANMHKGKRTFYTSSIQLDEKGLIERLNYNHKLF